MVFNQTAFGLIACIPKHLQGNPSRFRVGNGLYLKVISFCQGVVPLITVTDQQKPVPDIVIHVRILMIQNQNGDRKIFIDLLHNTFFRLATFSAPGTMVIIRFSS